MAETSPASNPFLGNQPPQIPEKPAEKASENLAVVPSSSLDSTAASPKVVISSDEVIPTPSSKWRHRTIGRWVVVFVSVALIAGGMYWWFRDAESVPTAEAPKSVTEAKEASPTIVPEVPSLALPESSAGYESENFKAGEIVIGGELQFLVDENEVGALSVENIRGEAFVEKNKKEVKLVVTWTTNKLTQATVRYSKGIGQTERSIDEQDYSYSHSVIISGLDPASTYLYTIDANDRYGNRVKSEPHAVFTGARTVSLFDLIAGAIGEVFGWAVTDK